MAHPRILLLALVASAACAAARVSLAPRLLCDPPFYETYNGAALPPTAVVGHVPIPEVPGGPPLASYRALVASLNALLDSAGWSKPLPSRPAERDEGLDLYVGTAAGREEASSQPCAERVRSRHPVTLAGWLPSARWRERLREIARSAGADFVLIIDVGTSDYPLWEKGGLTLNLELPLGTGYNLPVSWIHERGTSVRVLHLTGALLTADGRVMRVGAEGIMAREPRVLPPPFNLPFFTEHEMRRALAEHRREDLPERPLAWRVALQNLVAQLLGRHDLIIQ